MRWSFRIAEVRGIAINVHLTFLLILFFGAAQWGVPYGLAGAAFGVLLIVLLFVCVTLHELGHGLAAQRFGVPVREILLMPLGGLAVMEKPPRRPLHEMIISLAGPAVNVVLAIVLAAGIIIFAGPGQLVTQFSAAERLSWLLMAQWLLMANVGLVIFNMIPAFPLDGGRVLRAGLAMAMDEDRATAIAGRVGQFLAIVLGVVALFSSSLLLGVIAVYIFFGAAQERMSGKVRNVLSTRRASEAYNQHAITLKVDDRVSAVASYILTSYQPDFAVIHNQQPIGVVTRADVLRALASEHGEHYVTTVMHRDFVTVRADMMLDEVQELMAQRNTHVVAVFDGATYLGLIGADDLAEAYSVIAIQERQRATRQIAEAP